MPIVTCYLCLLDQAKEVIDLGSREARAWGSFHSFGCTGLLRSTDYEQEGKLTEEVFLGSEVIPAFEPFPVIAWKIVVISGTITTLDHHGFSCLLLPINGLDYGMF